VLLKVAEDAVDVEVDEVRVDVVTASISPGD